MKGLRNRALITGVLICSLIRVSLAQRPPDIAWIAGGNNGIQDMALSPDRSTVAVLDQTATLKFWRLSDSALKRTISSLGTPPYGSVAFSPDGTRVISGSTIWRVSDGVPLMTLPGSSANVAAWSTDGNTLATGEGASVRLWRASDGILLRTLIGHTGQVNKLTFAPDSYALASGGNDSTMRLWRVSDGQPLWIATSSAAGIVFSPDGAIITTRESPGIVYWNASDGTLAGSLSVFGPTAHAYSLDGSALFVGTFTGAQYTNPAIRKYRVSDGALLAEYSESVGVSAIGVLSSDGSFVSGDFYGEIKTWQPSPALPPTLITPLAGGLAAAAYSPDGSLVGVISNGGTELDLVRTINGTVFRRVSSLSLNTRITAFAFSPDSRIVAISNFTPSGGFYGTSDILLFDVSSGALVEWISRGTTYGAYHRLAFAPDEKSLVSVLANRADTCRLSDGALISSSAIGGYNSSLPYISPDGSRVALTYFDAVTSAQTLWLQRTSDGSLVATNSNVPGVFGFSPDGNYILGSGNGRLQVLRGSNLSPIGTALAPSGGTFAAAIAPYGDMIAVSEGRLISIWRWTDGVLLQTLEGPDLWPYIVALTYSPDGSHIICTRNDSTLLSILNPFPVSLSGLTIAPTLVQGGVQTAIGTVTLNVPAPAGGITISLGSDNPVAIPPDNVTVPVGAMSASFTIATSAVSSTVKATITATFAGATRSAQLTIQPAIPIKSFTLSPTTVAGGYTSVGVVTLTKAAPTGGQLVPLTDADPVTVGMPSSITVPAGKTSARFVIFTQAVSSAHSVALSAKSGGVTKAATLKVNPTTIGSFVLIPSAVMGGENAIGIVTLTLPAPNDVTVTVTTSNNTVAVPDTKTFVIPAGTLAGTFTVDTNPVAVSTNVIIGAKVFGVGKNATLTVTP